MAHSTEMQAALDKHPAHKTNLELQLIGAQANLQPEPLEYYQKGFAFRLTRPAANANDTINEFGPLGPARSKMCLAGYWSADEILNRGTN